MKKVKIGDQVLYVPWSKPDRTATVKVIFAACSQLIRLLRLDIGFLFVGPRFRYGFFPPVPRGTKLASRYRVRWQLRPLGLPPKLRDMPVIL